jgi:SulP family sulfate permease
VPRHGPPGNAEVNSPAQWRARWGAYARKALSDDLLAAAIVTILLVPQSLAYALLAGLPPVAGVMASLLPIVAYAMFGSSTTLAVGPVAVLAMMTAQAISPVAEAHGISPHLVALVLAIEMAAVFLVAALARLEMLAALLSAPVLHGFVQGAALAIAVGQLPALLGLPVAGNTVVQMVTTLRHVPALMPHAMTATLGLGSLALLWGIRRHGARLLARAGVKPGAAQLLARAAPIGVVVMAIAWIAGMPEANQGVALAGSIHLADGLRFSAIWQAPLPVWLALAQPAVLLALVAYVESLAVAEALAVRRGEKVLARRELHGLAAANLVAGLSGGMPVTGGFARSIVNFDAGARTRMAGVWTALFLGLAMLLLGDVLRFLPRAVLAATIIVAVLSLVDLAPFRLAWKYARAEFGLMLLVVGLTLLVGVEEALLSGVLVSVILLLQRTARPHWTEVGRLAGTEVFRNVHRFRVDTLPHVLAIRIDESLVFANSRWVSDAVCAIVRERAAVRHVVLMMGGVNAIDLTGLEVLMALDQELHANGVALHFSELKGPVKDRLDQSDPGHWLHGSVYMTQNAAFVALASRTGA